MKSLFVFLFVVLAMATRAQQVSGYWYGKATVANGGNSNTYLVELIIDQKGTGAPQALINYYFKNTFRSFKVAGHYDATTRTLLFPNIPITYFASSSTLQVDCMMDFVAQLRVAKAGSNLTGNFVGRDNYKYTCPEIGFNIQLNESANNKDSILTALREYKETYQLWTPDVADTVVAATVIQRPIVNYVVANAYKQRENIVAQEIDVASDSVKVDFYDNGEIDGDSISIFFNDRLLASSQRLSAKAIHLTIGLDTSKEYNDLAMFADNLGSIPPNTALMLIYDGTKRYEVRLSSSLEKNGTVRIRRKKSPLSP
jgi:hypothetical protein